MFPHFTVRQISKQRSTLPSPELQRLMTRGLLLKFESVFIYLLKKYIYRAAQWHVYHPTPEDEQSNNIIKIRTVTSGKSLNAMRTQNNKRRLLSDKRFCRFCSFIHLLIYS